MTLLMVHMTFKVVSEMTCNVSSRTLNPSVLYYEHSAFKKNIDHYHCGKKTTFFCAIIVQVKSKCGSC